MRYRRWTPAALAIPALLLAACGSSTSPGSAASSSMSTKSSMSSGMTGKSKSGSSGMMAASNATLMKVKTRHRPGAGQLQGLHALLVRQGHLDDLGLHRGLRDRMAAADRHAEGGHGGAADRQAGRHHPAGGLAQATYKGHPLYTYAGDTAPGQVKGNGLGGVWHALRVNAIDAVSANSLMMGTSSSPSPKASSSMGSGGSGGSGY